MQRVVILLLGCFTLGSPRLEAQSRREPTIRETGRLGRRLQETSGVAVSRAHPGVLWTHNDSGDGPYLYATDLRGHYLGAYRLRGATAEDWEDIALGPCFDSDSTCLYLADTGDNLELRTSVAVYAVREPIPPAGPGDTTRALAARKLELVYPDGPHDVEAIYVGLRDRALYLVTKGRTGPIRLFRVPRDAWRRAGPVRATRVQTLPISPNERLGRWVTGAAIRPDGRLVAVRTQTEVYFFRVLADGSLTTVGAPGVCRLGWTEEQGEAVDFLDDTTLVLTSEAVPNHRATIHSARCPGPAPRP